MTIAQINEDLAKSNLVIEEMKVRELDNPARGATNTSHSVQGYIIPYFTILGGLLPFYRTRLFDSDPKYKQPKDQPNHVYFPRGFLAAAKESPYILFTEGEKKAALATKMGFPCVAVGGVESWRNRIMMLPEETVMASSDKRVSAKLPSGSEMQEDFMSPLAIGMQELIDYTLEHEKQLIIIYDTDDNSVTYQKVQAAAATLGYELRFRGIPYNKIRQVRLPGDKDTGKMGLDDYLTLPNGNLPHLIDTCLKKPSAFPRHPNVRDYVNKRLQKSKMSRKEMQQVSMAILSELDSTGVRLRSKLELQSYYFDYTTHKLLPAVFSQNPSEVTDSPFGQYLYRKFGIGSADNRLLQWLGTQFTGEEPIEDTSPYRIIARESQSHDNVMFQISDGEYAKIDADQLTLLNNGTNGILFESGKVKPLDRNALIVEFDKQKQHPIPPCWWADVLTQVRLRDQSRQRIIAALLFYISPWLNRWRGTQLPIEITLGEAGSGKSTLYALRLLMQTGNSALRNAPSDMRDWAASVANTGGLHVTDNLQLTDKNFRNKLSDEICRIVTEPEPTIEQRKLYTNSDQMLLPVRCNFGVTAIKQPFQNADILDRSIIIELDKSLSLNDGSISYDSNWIPTQLHRFGGREAWIAHHLYVLQCFFKLVKQKWRHNYQAKHRLINLEQSLKLMAEVFGMSDAEKWITEYLTTTTMDAVRDADWALEGIITWSNDERKERGGAGKYFTANHISEWALTNEDFEHCEVLINPRSLGRYLQSHKTIVATSAKLTEAAGKHNNRIRYILEK